MDGNVKIILTISNSEVFREETVQFLNSHAAADFALDSRSLDEVIEQGNVSSPPPSVIFLDLNDCDEAHLLSYRRITTLFNTAQFIGVRHPADVEMVVKLVKAGVKNFVKYPYEPEEVKAMLASLPEASQKAATPDSHSGKMICFFSPKGGAGVTFLTINFAVAFIKQKKKVAICDISSGCGDIATCLNLVPEYTLRDVVDNAQMLDRSFLHGVMLKHSSGVEVLAAPREDQEPLTAQQLSEVQSVIGLMKECYDIVLVDCGHADQLLMQGILMQSERVITVANLDVPSLKGLVSSFNRFTKLNYDPQSVKVIINRYDAKHQMGAVIKEFEKKTKQQVAERLPNSYALAIEAINRGCPITEVQNRSDLGKKIEEFAKRLIVEMKTSSPEEEAKKQASEGKGGTEKKGLF